MKIVHFTKYKLILISLEVSKLAHGMLDVSEKVREVDDFIDHYFSQHWCCISRSGTAWTPKVRKRQ